MAPSERPSNAWKTGRARVLIVDDNVDAADTLAMMLEMEGYEVETASNGAEGVEKAQRFRPKLVLLDLDMPVMDGRAAARALRADRRGAVLVALSAHCGPATEHELRAVGFDVQLAKPVDPDRLLLVLRWFIAPGPAAGDAVH